MNLNGTARGTRVELFSTNAVSRPKRVGYWNDLSCNTFTGVGVDPVGDADFSAGLRRLVMDSVCVAEIGSTASIVRHTAGHISRQREEPSFLLHMQLRGVSANSQGGREVILRPGDATICDTGRPWTVAFNENARFLVCRLPASKLRERLPKVDDLSAVRLRHTAPGVCMLSAFLQTLILQAGHQDNSHWLKEVDNVVLDLIAVSCRSALGSDASQRDPLSRYERVLHYVETHATDSNLSVCSIAQRFGVGARSIQKLFAAHGTTLGSFVLRQRLEIASSRLCEPGSKNITAIALDAGFSDLTYFGRAFRKAFGMSPREYRQANRRDGWTH